MCRKAWWSSISQRAGSGACLRTGAHPIPAITSSIPADASPRPPSRWSSMRYAIGPQRTPPSDEGDHEGSGLVARLLVERVAFGQDVELVDLLGPVRRLDLLHRDRHRLL